MCVCANKCLNGTPQTCYKSMERSSCSSSSSNNNQTQGWGILTCIERKFDKVPQLGKICVNTFGDCTIDAKLSRSTNTTGMYAFGDCACVCVRACVLKNHTCELLRNHCLHAMPSLSWNELGDLICVTERGAVLATFVKDTHRNSFRLVVLLHGHGTTAWSRGQDHGTHTSVHSCTR